MTTTTQQANIYACPASPHLMRNLCFAFSWLIKRAAGLERAADRPGHEVIGAITLKHLYEIAVIKRRDTPNIPMEAICKNLMASCKSMGVKVVKSWEEQ